MTIAITRPPQRIMPFQPEPIKYEVQGMRATDIEYFVALALEKMGVRYKFQQDFLGGRQVKGGFVLDFLVLTVPLPTPVWVHGEYWHKGKQRAIDAFQEATIFWLLEGRILPAVVLFGQDLQTEEMAYRTVKREIRI